jgi:hypothetical protein
LIAIRRNFPDNRLPGSYPETLFWEVGCSSGRGVDNSDTTGLFEKRRDFNNNRQVLHASQPLSHSSRIKSHTSPHPERRDPSRGGLLEDRTRLTERSFASSSAVKARPIFSIWISDWINQALAIGVPDPFLFTEVRNIKMKPEHLHIRTLRSPTVHHGGSPFIRSGTGTA